MPRLREIVETDTGRLLKCSKCSKLLPELEFRARPNRRNGRASWCNECHALHQKSNGNNRLVVLKRHDMTPEQYDQMFRKQAGLCAICSKPQKVGGLRLTLLLDIDHDHSTGETRALLCRSCNVILGHVGDDPAILRAAADYLESHRA